MAGSNLTSAQLYTDFGGLARLRAMAVSGGGQEGAADSDRGQAAKEVAGQFEALFLQMMLKSMRDASQLSEDTDSDQTRFYQEMFDKQIAIDLATRNGSVGLSEMLERDLGGSPPTPAAGTPPQEALLHAQFEHAAAKVGHKPGEHG